MADALKQHPHPGLASPPPAVIPLDPPPDLTPRKSRHGSENRQRVETIHVRVFPPELGRLKAEAAAAGMSVGGYLRTGRLGEDAAGPRVRRRLPAIEADLLARNNAALNHIGNNINQTTRALNELLLSGVQSGDARLVRLIEEWLAINRAAYRDLAVTLDATRRACGHDREG